jgi:hypothetical protein
MKVIVKTGKKGISPPKVPQIKKDNIFTRIKKCVEIIRNDLFNRTKDEKWEDYQRFCKLARGKR